jgi:patatin-related protein
MTTSSPADSATKPGPPIGFIDPAIDRELRVAVTMNGGVSLAVYIGGVAHELDRFTRKAGGYFELLEKFGYAATPPVIDVITGTSAGGINAAALALAQANRNGDLGLLKELWIQHGQIGDLLREPFHRGPASLLKGDDYFYPQIRSAFRRLIAGYERATYPGPKDPVRPVDLTIPATLLTPVKTSSADYLHTAVIQPQHAGLFHFFGGTGDPVSDDGPADMFSESGPGGIDETVEALALASRASAGFPAAFEPTFIPVGHNSKIVHDRPDMALYADWARLDKSKDLSRFAVDGGVLANTPTRPALEGIRRREVSRTMVRRILILVHPHAEYARDVKNVADEALPQPTLVGALAGVARATGSVGSRKYVEDIQQHNELALRWRDGRQAAMAQFDAEDLSSFLGETDDKHPAWQLFRKLRLRRGAYESANNVRKEFATSFAKLIEYTVKIMEAEDGAEGLAFLPKKPPEAKDFTHGEWQWGLNLAVGVASQASELLKQLIDAEAEIPSEIRELAREGWKDAVNGVVQLDRLVDQEQKAEAEPSQSAAPNTTGGSATGSAAKIAGISERQRIWDRLSQNLENYNKQMLRSKGAEDGDWGPEAMRILREIVEKLVAVIRALDALPTDKQTDGDGDTGATVGGAGENTVALLHHNNPLRRVGNREDELLKRMLQIEIIAYLTAEQDNSDGLVPTVPIDFVQLSAHIEQDFASGFTADDKLAGMSLHRFGAFLKRSWRANDWIWGRLDAVKILMLVLLTPDIVRGYRRRHHPNGSALDVVDDIARAAFDKNRGLYDKLRGDSLKGLLNKAVEDVQRAIEGDDAPMRNLAGLAAYGYQVEVAKEDVPWLAGTIRDDRDDGAVGAETTQFLNLLEQRADSMDGYDLLTSFAESGIGQEALAEQMPSDLMIRTTATAAATVVTALSAEESGLAFARPATKVARGLVALPYWVLLALTGRGQIARAVATAFLALGVSLTALSLVTDLPGLMGKLVPTVGVASLLTLFGYAALRTQSIVHGAALLGLFIPVISYAVVGGKADRQPDIVGETRVSLIWVVLLLVWVMAVANFSSQTRSPVAAVLRALKLGSAFCIENRRPLIAGVGVSAATGLIAFFVRHVIARWYRGSWLPAVVNALVQALHHGPWDGHVWSIATALVVGAAIAGFLIAWQKSGRFPRSRRTDSPPHTPSVDPAWLATAWSPVYGLIYGVLLVPVLASVAAPWARVASVVSLTLGLFFSFVVVSAVPYSREKRLIRRLVARFEPDGVPEARKDVIEAFDDLGEFTDYLIEEVKRTWLSRLSKCVRPPAARSISDFVVRDGKCIGLTRHGRRVRRRARRISARRARATAENRPTEQSPGPMKTPLGQTPSGDLPATQR